MGVVVGCTVGGAATYFSAAASLFQPVRLVAVIGDDFPEEGLEFLRERGVDLEGLERASGESFFWSGRYHYDLNTRDTLETRLGVFGDFQPKIPASYRDTPFVFLANIDPKLQLDVLDQMAAPRFVAADTMNYWIEGHREPLMELLGRIDCLLLNDSEARELSGDYNLTRAARWIRERGPEIVVIKKGEHGALLFTEEQTFFAPGYPLEEVFDPTGAGDAFAGGFVGWLAYVGSTEPEEFRDQQREMLAAYAAHHLIAHEIPLEGRHHFDAVEAPVLDRIRITDSDPAQDSRPDELVPGPRPQRHHVQEAIVDTRIRIDPVSAAEEGAVGDRDVLPAPAGVLGRARDAGAQSSASEQSREQAAQITEPTPETLEPAIGVLGDVGSQPDLRRVEQDAVVDRPDVDVAGCRMGDLPAGLVGRKRHSDATGEIVAGAGGQYAQRPVPFDRHFDDAVDGAVPAGDQQPVPRTDFRVFERVDRVEAIGDRDTVTLEQRSPIDAVARTARGIFQQPVRHPGFRPGSRASSGV